MKHKFGAVEVIIRGPKGSGKTTTLMLVGAALQAAGLNVVCKDDGEAVEVRHTTRTHCFDDRKVKVKTISV